MKLSSTIAAVGGLASVASAAISKRNYWQTTAVSVECQGGNTVTSTVTVTAGAAVHTAAPSATQYSSVYVYSTKDSIVEAGSTKTDKATYTKPSHTQTGPAGAKKTITVDVGAAGQLIYAPNSVDAAVGDVIAFNFLALNHTVSQSNFATPCTFNGGFDTSFEQFNPKNESGKFIKTFTVKDTKPTWFYCRQTVKVSHCGKGMVFGINPAGKMEQFIKNAEAQNGGNATATATATGTATAAPALTTVTVGLDNGKTLKFSPPFLPKQAKGSKIVFDFRFKNHTLTESSFADPCKKLAATPIDTNFQNVNVADIAGQNATTITLDTDESKPRWFYCKQANGTPQGHCGQGMVFAINTDEKKFGEFVDKAKATLPKVKGRSMRLGDLF